MDSFNKIPDTRHESRLWRGQTWFVSLFIAAIVIQILASLPVTLDFKLFAFYDPGSTLKADWLISPAGGNKIPTIDFAYSYGLLSLEFGRAWFATFGRDPWAFWLYGSFGMLAMTLGFTRLIRTLNFNWQQVVILLCALPLAIPPYYLSLTHVTEAALLIHALADQTQKKYWRALLLVTITAMFKPSMAYVYGLMLMVIILKPQLFAGWKQSPDRQGPVRQFLPAMMTAILVCAILIADFGVQPLINTLLPITGGASYKAAGFGFLNGAGRNFWMLDHPAQYIFTPTGWWLASTIIMWITAIAIMIRRYRGILTPGGETLITLAVMHTVFVFMFFAWAGSWTYYAYLPAIGLATMWNAFPIKKWSFMAILILILCGSFSRLSMTIGEWAAKSRFSDTSGLWIYGDQLTRWRYIQQFNQPKTYWLVNGFSGQMFPGITTPPSWWLSPKLQNEKEIAAIRKGISESDTVIRWAEHGRLDPWLYPELADVTRDFETVHRDGWFAVEKRKGLRTGD